jgi:UDP-2-acetamido-3-amino-2,3-dideoxy-glucuronate N-acetyltransferase
MKKHIAVIGTGYWGKNLVRNFHALGALGAVCDTNAQVLQSMIDQYPGVRAVSTLSDALTDPVVKGVAIATPAVSHAEIIREALLADKDIYVEKPLSLSERDGQELTTLARDRGRVLMVGHLLWHHPTVLKLKELIQEGELGRIQYIYSNRLNLGKLRREENVLWSFAPHDVSVILGLLDEMPESIQAQGGNYLHQRIADTTVSLLNFASGVRAHIFVSWLHPFKEQKLIVVGDRKMAVFDDTAPWGEKLLLYPHRVKWSGNVPVANKADAEKVEVVEEEPLRAECRHFLECMRTRSTPRTDGEEGLRVLKVLNACQEALEKQGIVFLGATIAKGRDYHMHESAVVDDGVEIGAGSKIWHFTHILKGSKIGRDCIIGQNVMIGPDVVIGDKCKIQNNVSIYKGVTLEDGVFCGPSCVFTNVNTPRAEIERKDEFLATRVRRGVTIGANATIVCGLELGQYSTIGAGAVVTKDVPPFALVAGVPARRIGWVSHTGDRLGPDLVCPRTGKRYGEVAPGRLEELTDDGARRQTRKAAAKSSVPSP